jgi:hypothetical protein
LPFAVRVFAALDQQVGNRVGEVSLGLADVARVKIRA